VDIDQVISGFQRLSASDFDLNDVNSDGMERLEELTSAVRIMPSPERAVPEMFRVMERMPDVELGSPGPLVHTLEGIPGYERHLADSVRLQPSLLSVWMVNRILNSPIAEDRRLFWMELLQQSADRPDVPDAVRRDTLDFLARRRGKETEAAS